VRVYPGNRKCLRQAKYAYLKVTMCPYWYMEQELWHGLRHILVGW
jgi:hypothetical protein